MKKLLSFVLTLIVCIIPLQSFAVKDEMFYFEGTASFEDVVYLKQYFETAFFTESDETEEVRYEEAKQALIDGVRNYENIIDIFEYNIPVDFATALFSDVFYYNPELFYISNAFGVYGYEEYPDTIAFFEFQFAYTPSEYATRKRQFDNEVAKITSLVKPNMSELERALIVHDYLDLHCEYDTEPMGFSIEGNPIYRDSSFRADGVIVDKVGVCQSYSMAYYYIMSLLGVETDYVKSEAMNHMWNIFKIDDNWYHVDSTWDDPVPDEYAYVSHQHFLASNALISSGENPHHDWIAKHECTDTTLDNHFWRNINGAIALDGDGKAYYHTGLKSSTGNFPYYFEILSHDLDTHETQVVTTEEGKYWYTCETNEIFVSSDVLFYNGKLYYNTPTEIVEINTDGTDKKTILTYDKGDGYIYGSKLNEYLLLFGVEQHMNHECTKPEHELTEYYISLENKIGVKPTDIDVAVLRKYLDYDNMPGNIIATLYDENDIIKETKILTLSECNLTGPDSTVPVNFESETGKYIKLMWWDMNTISPIANNIKYPIQ